MCCALGSGFSSCSRTAVLQSSTPTPFHACACVCSTSPSHTHVPPKALDSTVGWLRGLLGCFFPT